MGPVAGGWVDGQLLLLFVVREGSGELGGELLASGDVEFPKDVPEMCFHGALGDEQALGDLAVRPTFSCEACDA
jgi:hypothetical protein